MVTPTAVYAVQKGMSPIAALEINALFARQWAWYTSLRSTFVILQKSSFEISRSMLRNKESHRNCIEFVTDGQGKFESGAKVYG